MHIEFGWSLDGSSWADAASGGAAGQVRLGPRGLVALLQTRLGLTRPEVDPAVRTAQWMRLIEQHLAEAAAAAHQAPAPSLFDAAGTEVPDPARFWPAASFAVDPWSTARQLLRWRDAAIEAGWTPPAPGAQALPARLEALAVLERRAVVGMPGTTAADGRPATLSPGPADDLRELVGALDELTQDGGTWPLGIEQIRLRERPEALPGMWPRLFALLASARVAFEAAEPAPGPAPQLEVVACRDEWSAADVAARYLAAHRAAAGSTDRGRAGAMAGPPEGAGAPLTLLATGDTDVLDRALHRRGLPAVGHVAPSRDRAHHQVLGLFLDVATAPVDVHQLAALLDLRVLPGSDADAEPVGLVPAATRRALLGALTREPGVGGPAWRAALARLAERVAEAPADQADAARTALEAGQEIDRLVTEPLPADGLRPAALSARLAWLADRLRRVSRGGGDLLAALGQVQTLREVLAMLAPAVPLSRRTLQQVIDACGGSGASPRARAEVAPWQVTTRAAHLRGGGTVLWWAPADPPATGVVWDAPEVAALAAGGARVLSPEATASLQVDAALAGLTGARRVIAVLPGRRLETPEAPCGLLAHLEVAAGRGEGDRRSPGSLLSPGTWSLAGLALPVTVPPRQRPAPPPGTQDTIAPAGHLLRERISFTEASTLIGCPRHWVLEHALGIRPAQVAALPTGERMIGTLVHAVVERLVQQRHDPHLGGTPLEAPDAAEIGAAFDALVPQLASELDLPGRAAQRAEVRARTVRSLGEFFTRMTDAGLRITGTEVRFCVPLELPLADGPRTLEFVGSRDVDARDADGRPTVIDLKWSRSRSRYADLFDTGEAVQLASYAWSLARTEELDRPADVGYFLLRTGEFVSARPELDAHRRAPMDVEESWGRLVRAITEALDEISRGHVRAGCRCVLEDAGLDAGAPWAKQKKATDDARAAARAAGGLVVATYCAGGDHAQLCGLIGDRR